MTNSEMLSDKPYFSLLHITDPHILATPYDTLLGVNTAYYFKAILKDALRSQSFDLCLLTGDLAQDPCQASYQYLLEQLQEHAILSRCLPGNHDDFRIMRDVLCTALVNCEKRTQFGNWQIISLNSQIVGSTNGLISDAELAFLEQTLNENTELYSLIAVHHHCLPTGSRWMDKMIIKNANELLALINRYPNVKCIINGHIHQEMELFSQTLRVLSTPSTCFQFKPGSEAFALDSTTPGYRWLHLYQDGNINSGVIRLNEPLVGLQKAPTGY